MLLRIVPDNTKIKFMWLRKVSFPLSIVLVIASIAAFFTVGLNYGIDFKGGTIIEIKTDGPADVASIRSDLSSLNLGDVQVQEFGGSDDILIRVEEQPGGELAQQAVIGKVRTIFEGQEVDFRRVEVVGPRVSGELAQAGAIAVAASLLAILFYIWFRFEWQFAVGAILTTANDVVITIGLFVLLQLDFSLSSIAAVLTIIGYSLNDTVVVYDRIRENLRKYKKRPLTEVLDMSINETLSRTTMTSLTTLLALFALYIFGGEVIQSFTLAMIFGIVIGTYSSIFLAAPFLILFNLRAEAMSPKDDDGEKDPKAKASA
ncbi:MULTISPECIES: protein translocase subunit SecF [Stappiaceae]|jgi:preprotein translocase SecF subunit|uniref:protein translocase subunit SecF n=1 Tax=Stappiaceae TaxID=2821832 RepID=UPI000784B375|nr:MULTISPECIES: protein translocase subunit SecF [Stappiaceae]MEC9404636.1 protein translocase subunit SecF [Pseudomonadota bacterium]AMN53536.1 preprotein translocase subunit SecF [Labrenzia sp. CP4]MBN8181161.1 protein translocase subunit SecF [Roseibium aggregatum]MEC9417373.1 protein translocase subunit SecF [Pseudomonadota bacterium]MEE2864798.1 protein translocase subunit SecF [Pseudomonadota bacterium]